MAEVSPQRGDTKNNKSIFIPSKENSEVRITLSDQAPSFNNCYSHFLIQKVAEKNLFFASIYTTFW